MRPRRMEVGIRSWGSRRRGALLHRCGLVFFAGAGASLLGLGGGNENHESAARIGAFARHANTALVHIHQLAHECESNTQPAMSSVETVIDLDKHVKDFVEHGGGNADARISDAKND